VVVNAGNHDLHIDAAVPGFNEDLNPGVVRYEVRVCDIDRPLSRYDGEVIHDTNRRRGAFRRAQKDLSGYRSGRLRQREIIRSINEFSCYFQPVLGKAVLEALCSGPLDPNLDIVPVFRILRISCPLIGYSSTSGKCNTAIHDYRLTMIPVI